MIEGDMTVENLKAALPEYAKDSSSTWLDTRTTVLTKSNSGHLLPVPRPRETLRCWQKLVPKR